MYSERQQKIYVADAVTLREAEKQECNLLGLVSTRTHFPDSRECVRGDESESPTISCDFSNPQMGKMPWPQKRLELGGHLKNNNKCSFYSPSEWKRVLSPLNTLTEEKWFLVQSKSGCSAGDVGEDRSHGSKAAQSAQASFHSLSVGLKLHHPISLLPKDPLGIGCCPASGKSVVPFL